MWNESLRVIVDYLDCQWDSDEGHPEDVWRTFNRVYNEVIGSERSTIPPTYESNGFQMPVEIKYNEDTGRAVHTKVSIKEGDLMYVSTNNAQFHTAQEYRAFLRSLPVDLACDILIWAFPRVVSAERKDEFIACVDLDEGSFVNSANRRTPECNMELGTETGLYGCDLKFYARRDIREGEEIRADYSDFAEPHGWSEMGLL